MLERVGSVSLAFRGMMGLLFLAPVMALGDESGRRVDPKLFDQVASDRWSVRHDACEKLVALGEDALPDLYAYLKSATDWEARARVESAIARILDNRLIGMSLVTLKLDKAPANRAIEELARQAHAKIPADPPTLLTGGKQKLVTLDVDHRPFWEVMQMVCRQGGLSPATINKHNRDIGLGVTKGDMNWNQKPIVLAGPLLIRADRLMRISTAVLRDGGAGLNEFTISLTAFAEPKLKVIDYSGQLRLLEVVDEKGNSLIDPENPGQADFEVMGSSSAGQPGTWEVGASLKYPRNGGQRITKFQASMNLEVLIQSAKFEAPFSGGIGKEMTIDGVRIRLRSIDSNRCQIRIFRDGRTDLEWQHLWMLLSRSEACLSDDKDHVVARSQQAVDQDANDDQKMDLRLRFGRDGGEFSGDSKQKRGDAVKLVWEFPAQTRVLTIPFEFRDLPIPR